MHDKIQHLLAILSGKMIGVILCLGGTLWTSPVEATVTAHPLSGFVEVLLTGEQAWKPLLSPITLQAGDQIRTEEDGTGELQCEDGSKVYLDAQTQIVVNHVQFSEAQKTRVFRFRLLAGSVTVSVVASDFKRFTLTPQALEKLRNEQIPDESVEGLQSLENREFPDETAFFNAVQEQIGGAQAVRNKWLLLAYADSQKDVFEIDTDIAVTRIASTEEVVIDIQKAFQCDLIVKEGMVAINQTREGPLNVSGLVDNQEGLTFSSNVVGTWVRLGVDINDCQMTLESNGPIQDITALIGHTNDTLTVKNNKYTPPLNIKYQENFVTLEEEEEATFGIAADREISVDIPEFANGTFMFWQISFFVFVNKGCPDINDQENCCGDLQLEHLPPSPGESQPVVPAAPLASTPEGGRSPEIEPTPIPTPPPVPTERPSLPPPVPPIQIESPITPP